MGFLSVVFELVLWIFILRSLVDMFPNLAHSALASTLRPVTEPVLAPVRRLIHPIAIGDALIDVSAVVVVLLLYYLRTLV